MAFFFLKKTAQKVHRTFTKIAAVNIIIFVKRNFTSKGNGFLLNGHGKNRCGIRDFTSKGSGFLLDRNA